MKLTIILLLVLILTHFATGQSVVFDTFDEPLDSNYIINSFGLGDSSRVTPYQEQGIYSEGTGALRLEYNIEANQSWGGVAILVLQPKDAGSMWDFSGYESLAIQYYNKNACSDSGRAELQILFYDESSGNTDNIFGTEWWYSFHYVLDRKEGWNAIVLPLKDVGEAADDGPGSTGFWLTGREGIPGNGQLDLDKIGGIGISVQINGTQDSAMVSGATIFDYFVFNISPATSIPSAESAHAGFELKQNYPNPFNPSTQITFYLSRQSNVKLNVFDMLGREVAVLIDENQSPGTHHINFNAEDLPSGVYFYRLQTADFLETKKMILAK